MAQRNLLKSLMEFNDRSRTRTADGKDKIDKKCICSL